MFGESSEGGGGGRGGELDEFGLGGSGEVNRLRKSNILERIRKIMFFFKKKLIFFLKKNKVD